VFAACAMLDALVMTGPFDQNAPHRQSSCGEEVPAPIPLSRLVGDAQVGLVYERRRLQCLMRLSLTGEPGPRELAEFVIHFRQQLAGTSRLITRGGCHEAAQL
jgi:hypothetical protein